MFVRFFSTGARLQGEMQFGRIFNKVMNSDRTRKNRTGSIDSHMPSNPNRPIKVTTHKNRRVTVLNKVFMKYITDLMATGEVGSKLINRGIEISHVVVASDYSAVNVYWFSQSGDVPDESIEKILQASAGHLQHELSKLRVIGQVPPINFVKNRQYSAVKEIEELLAKVDFGEDYTPTAHIVNSKLPTLETSLSPEIRAKISQIDSSSTDCDDPEIYRISIPDMRQDVMGFDHSSIMKKVKTSLDKSKIAEQNRDLDLPTEPKGIVEPTSAEVIEFMSLKEQKELFSDFLKKRRIEEKKKEKMRPLFEVKLQEEMDWLERSKHEYDEDEIDIDEPYRDDCNDDLKSK